MKKHHPNCNRDGKNGKTWSKFINMGGMSTTCLLVTARLQISSEEYVKDSNTKVSKLSRSRVKHRHVIRGRRTQQAAAIRLSSSSSPSKYISTSSGRNTPSSVSFKPDLEAPRKDKRTNRSVKKSQFDPKGLIHKNYDVVVNEFF